MRLPTEKALLHQRGVGCTSKRTAYSDLDIPKFITLYSLPDMNRES